MQECCRNSTYKCLNQKFWISRFIIFIGHISELWIGSLKYLSTQHTSIMLISPPAKVRHTVLLLLCCIKLWITCRSTTRWFAFHLASFATFSFCWCSEFHRWELQRRLEFIIWRWHMASLAQFSLRTRGTSGRTSESPSLQVAWIFSVRPMLWAESAKEVPVGCVASKCSCGILTRCLPTTSLFCSNSSGSLPSTRHFTRATYSQNMEQ